MARRDRRPEALPLDAGVLAEGAVCELHGDLAVAAHGGVAVHPWRHRFLAARRAGLDVVRDARDIEDGRFDQVVVHVQKGRAATADDLCQAWRILAPNGHLFVCGTNALGIASSVKRLATELDLSPVVVANRARARVARFVKADGPAPKTEPPGGFVVQVDCGGGETVDVGIETRPGIFSANELDAGSALLLDTMLRDESTRPRGTPRRVVDLGCGSGVLGVAAALRWRDAEVEFVDADARALACAERNVRHLGLADRSRFAWWDATEAPPASGFELAVVNPPFHHTGVEVDLAPPLAMIASLERWLAPGGRALLVANVTLPYEAPAAEIGRVETVRVERGYKLLSIERSASSSSQSGRAAPGSRPSGSSRAPIRSR